MKQYEMCELAFSGAVMTENWAQADVRAFFTHDGETIGIAGFYAGDGVYKVRFLPEKPGIWHYQVSGAVSAAGDVTVEAASGHGPVRASGCHFAYSDGALFYPFGTTVYALAHQEDELVEQTLESLRGGPFNKVRMCVFPKHYDFNHNEPPVYAFEKKEDGSWDVSRPCFAFWDRLEGILTRLMDMGIQADLILFHPYDRWGFSRLTQAENRIYLDYLLRRLSAFPNIWWSLANEYDLCAFKSQEDWYEIEDFVAEHDPAHHLIGNHNCFVLWDHSRKNITHASIQTRMLTRVAEWREKYQKPVVVDECCYEGNIEHFWGCISGKEMTNRFWRVVTTGGYCTHGETFYDPEDILWWAKGGKLHGESPARIGFLRKIVEELPGPLDPVPGQMDGLLRLLENAPEALGPMMAQAPAEYRFIASRVAGIPKEELRMFAASDYDYQGHCGEDAYLVFYDLHTCAESYLDLPRAHTYRVELIDTWEMTREELLCGATGRTKLTLPGKEGMAVLATRI